MERGGRQKREWREQRETALGIPLPPLPLLCVAGRGGYYGTTTANPASATNTAKAC
jgi:hypothetical protein